MPRTHEVRQGEHLSTIAAKYGFLNFKTIWEHPANAELRQLRQDPHVLNPGDKVFIPDRLPKTEKRPTGNLHTFKIERPPLFLRLRLENIDSEVLRNDTCSLAVEEPSQPKPPPSNPPQSPFKTVKTDAKGILEQKIDPLAHEGELVADIQNKPIKFNLKIGDLDPATTLVGQQARLNNMGYFAGYDEKDLDQFRWAIEEFQEDVIRKGGSQVADVPNIVPEPDIPPEQRDPKRKTGIVDKANTAKRLEQEYGC